MDLSTIVQKVRLDHVTITNSSGLTWNFYFNCRDSALTRPPCPQGFSSLNDTPHMVTEQTRSVVESKFGRTHLVPLSLVSSPVLCSGLLLTLTDSLNNLSLRCADSDGWHRQKHQQLFQNIPRAELFVQLHHLYQPRSRQDWGPLPWNWQNGLLQVNPRPESWEKL